MIRKARSIALGTAVAALALPAAAADDGAGKSYTPPRPPGDFTPPPDSAIPDGPMGDMIRRGRELFMHTQKLSGDYVGNGMNCVNCHLDRGRKASSAPLWAAFGMFPAYRGKNDHVNTMIERIQGCFRYSMDGTPPPADSKPMVALLSYHFWLAKGAPVGVALPGRGFPAIDKPDKPYSVARGKTVYERECAICHGSDGGGRKAEGTWVFPPLWGSESYNFGAGMHRINTAAAFIKPNMPLGRPDLTTQEAWDVAAYINSKPRPQDPRFTGELAQTKKRFHDHMCLYGTEQHGRTLGAPDGE